MVDTKDLKSFGYCSCAGSTPVRGTIKMNNMENKKLDTIVKGSVRSVMAEANKMGLSKEDIVTIFPYEGQIFLVYFK